LPPRRLPSWLQGPGNQSGWLYWVLLAALLWAVLAVVYPGPVLQGKVFLSSDASNSDAFARVGEASLQAGHYPLWNPYLFAGMPTFGSLAFPRYVYPPAQVFNLLQQKLGFVPLTWLFGHLLFGGLGMMWLLSRWRLPTAALVLGAVAFVLFPQVVAWGVHGHGSKLGAAMYLPWIVGWALRVQDGGNRVRRSRAVAMLGLLLGLQFLRGHVQITYYTLATVGWLTLWNAVLPFEEILAQVAPRVRAARLGLVICGLAIGFLVGAVLLVPVHDYAAISIRGQDSEGGGGVGLEYATGWSLAPGELSTLVLPDAAGFGKATYLGLMPFNDYPNYLGFLLLLLAAAAASRRRAALMTALAAFVVLVIMASFGEGFYALLYRYLPFFNKFRVPSMILILVAFSVALLAPRGLTAWVDGQKVLGRSAVLPAVLGGLGLLCLLGGGAALAKTSYLTHLAELAAKGAKQAPTVLLEQAWLLHKASLVRIGLLCLAAAGALWFSLRHEAFRSRGLGWVLIGLVLLDLGAVNRKIIHPELSLQSVVSDGRGSGRLVPAMKVVQDHQPPSQATPDPAAAVIAAAVGHDRVWPLGSTGSGNAWMADGLRSLGGYHPAKLAQYEQIRKRLYGERPAGRLANWLAGRAVTFDRPFSAGELDALRSLGLDLAPDPKPAGSLVVYRNQAALPRARLVPAWAPVQSLPANGALGAFLDGVAAGGIDLVRTVYLAATPDPAPIDTGTELPVPAFTVDGLDEVVLQVDCPVPAVLVLADMMAPGWQVEVDGTARPLLTADLVLRAVALAEGPHTVRFHYRDPSLRKGLTLTLIGVILIIGLMAIPVVLTRLRRKPSPGASGEQSPDE
jgi:hypothetical protein